MKTALTLGKRRSCLLISTTLSGEEKKLEGEEVENDQQNHCLKLVCDVRIILPRHLEITLGTGDTSLDPQVHSKRDTNVVNAEWSGLKVGEAVEGNENCEHIISDVDYSLECQWVFGADHEAFESSARQIGKWLNVFTQQIKMES